MGRTASHGAQVAQLRKAGITQAQRAGIAVSLLSKIEIGDRTLPPGIVAAIARALQITLGALYGEAGTLLARATTYAFAAARPRGGVTG